METQIECTRCGSTWTTTEDMQCPTYCVNCETFSGLVINSDPINPTHYKDGDTEVWQQMIALFGVDQYKAFCRLNAFKYRMRAGKKEGNSAEQDINKALWYEQKLREI